MTAAQLEAQNIEEIFQEGKGKYKSSMLRLNVLLDGTTMFVRL